MIAWHSHNVDNHAMFRSHTGLAALPSMDNMKELEEALLALFFPEEYTSCRYNALAILRSSIISALRYYYPDETESTLIAISVAPFSSALAASADALYASIAATSDS